MTGVKKTHRSHANASQAEREEMRGGNEHQGGRKRVGEEQEAREASENEWKHARPVLRCPRRSAVRWATVELPQPPPYAPGGGTPLCVRMGTGACERKGAIRQDREVVVCATATHPQEM